MIEEQEMFFQYIALTQPMTVDASIAIAATRAGELGILDLEFSDDVQMVMREINHLAHSARGMCGIKLSGWDKSLAQAVVKTLPENVRVVLLTFSNEKRMHSLIQIFRNTKRIILLEVNALEQALVAEKLSVDGLIAKGNEAGGYIGEKTSFVLLQQVLAKTALPVWAQGGIGLHSAAACFAAGARGVVLDSQLALTRESALPAAIKNHVRRMDGTETFCLGGQPLLFRAAKRPGISPANDLVCAVDRLREPKTPEARDAAFLALHERFIRSVAEGTGPDVLWPLGQDASIAPLLAAQAGSVGAIIQETKKSVRLHLSEAKNMADMFGKDSALAMAHGTDYPIVQGPMARVSDNAAFAARVADEGALPFIALSQMKPAEISRILEGVRGAVGSRPWGIGLLGFNESEFFQEQIHAAESFGPRYAIIAGGLPNQVAFLEGKGMSTYVHVPSATLLEMFLDAGARKFIFEGNECGGHIGPRTSFVLWDTMIASLLEKIRAGLAPHDLHILFAGGIHDGLSAAMVAAMSAPLSKAGVKIGVVMGTAYLFTEEIVATEAIAGKYQKNALECAETCVLEMSPGHALRCCHTPFVESFTAQHRQLIEERRPHQEITAILEKLVLGRARIATKGLAKNPSHGTVSSEPYLICIDEEKQQQDGLYMLGQLAALLDKPVSIRGLHMAVADGSCERLENLPEQKQEVLFQSARTPDVAIIGMGCIFPKARNVRDYWNNILHKINVITEVPESRWDWRIYFDENKSARDKIYSRWGGFIDDIPFDPMKYGIPPSSLDSIEPLHLMTLEVVDAALRDAGYGNREFPRETTSVIIGTGGGIGDAGQRYIWRSTLPQFFEVTSDQVVNRIQEWTEDSFSGILMNVLAGRVANRFNLGGINYTVDAACASSLASVYDAVRELETGSSDMVLAGGADASQNAFTFTCFSKTNALSPSGQCKVFDESADGTVISEGVAMLVLKRLEDAERDGDRIYAVIKSVAGSSDGRGNGLTAPKVEGQMLALKRAYAKAGFPPTTVELFEAHGTGTAVGDQVEATSLARTLMEHQAAPQSAAIGSVKSMIGHTKGAAGLAGMIKISLALYHKVMPPTMGVTKPNSKMDFINGPLYVNSELRPWIGAGTRLRRAAASAFGFGGANFHAVAEEYPADCAEKSKPAVLDRWPAELFVWADRSREEIMSAVSMLHKSLSNAATVSLENIAYTLNGLYERKSASTADSVCRLAIVAISREDLLEKLKISQELLSKQSGEIADPRGVYFNGTPSATPEKIAFLFPGQGSQYPDMLRDVAVLFPEVRMCFQRANAVLGERFPELLSSYIFPPPAFSPEQEQERKKRLSRTDIAQPSLGAAGFGMYQLLCALGLRPDMVAGHSYGEYVALAAAGVFDEETLYALSEARGRFIIEAASGSDLGTMAAVKASADQLRSLLKDAENITIANINAPLQTVISGTKPAVEQAVSLLKMHDIQAVQIPVSGAFHSPLVAPAQQRLADYLNTVYCTSPTCAVFSNTHAAPYQTSPADIVACLADHMVKPVEFVREIEAMYDAGARIFIEAGPGTVLTNLTKHILANRQVCALAMDMQGRPGLEQFLKALAQLAVRRLPISLERLYVGRSVQAIDITAPGIVEAPLSAGWRVNGTRILGPSNTWKPRSSVDIPLATYRVRDRRKRSGAAAETPAGTMQAPFQEPSRMTIPEAMPTLSGQFAFPQMPALPSGSADADAVLMQFQQMMNAFLETQKSVMTAYLQGDAELPVTPSLPVMQPTGAVPVTAPVIATPTVVEPQNAAAPTVRPVSQDGGEHLKQELLRITGERTGYPAEMLNLELDIEADLGIDSIKRVEIMSAFVKGLSEAEQQKIRPQVEALSRLRTLGAIIEKAKETLGTGAEVTVVAVTGSAGSQVTTMSGEHLKQELLRITGERTGYPAEMLNPELDIEADLGIDSIKRVEIMSAFVKGLSEAEQQRIRPQVEALSRLRTLGAIIEKAKETLGSNGVEVSERPSDAPACPTTGSSTTASSAGTGEFVPRFVAVPVVANAADKSLVVPQGGTFLITDDGSGIADLFAEKLRTLGGDAVILKMIRGESSLGADICAFDMTEPGQVNAVVEHIWNSTKQIVGLVHLLPLGHALPFADMNLQQWRDCMQTEMKSLYLLTRALSSDLKKHRGWLFAATALAGDPDMTGAAFAGQAGSAGFLKSVAQEWPEVVCRVMHLEMTESPACLVERILAEMELVDGPVEVESRMSGRVHTGTQAISLYDTLPEQVHIEKEWVVLITGGAAGITAEIARMIAARYQPTLVLAGRSVLPQGDESPETAGLTDEKEIKTRLIAGLRSRGEAVTPAMVDAAYGRLMQNRAMRANIAAMQACGARVHYFSADVRDEQSFGGLIDTIYATFGRLDGVVHGAGTIEDRLVENKTPESFDRVFNTKVDSAFILSRKLRPETLRFIVFFSSVAGFFGNRGQSDYAAANEVVNQLARHLDRTWPSRVVAMNWGPWKKLGMVTPEVERQFRERGVQMIPPEAGCRLLDEEIRFGRKGDAVVVFGDGPWGQTDTGGLQLLPFFAACETDAFEMRDGAFRVVRSINLQEHEYLKDHCIDGMPVLPLAMAVELMAETAQLAWKAWHVTEVRDLHLLKGIIPDGDGQHVAITVKEISQQADTITAEVQIADADISGRLFYRSTIVLSKKLSAPPIHTVKAEAGMNKFPISVDEAYDSLLFHGPLFQCICSAEGVSETGMLLTVRPSSPAAFIADANGAQWIIDPAVLDCGPQVAILWAQTYLHKTVLPARFRALRVFGSCPSSDIRCHFEVENAEEQSITANVYFFGPDSRMIYLIEGLEAVGYRKNHKFASGKD